MIYTDWVCRENIKINKPADYVEENSFYYNIQSIKGKFKQ